MELAKNIFFNTDKLVGNSIIKISYTGYLFQNNSEKVYIHYGFDNEWKELNDVEMQKTDLGFQAELFLPEFELLNFCFRNENNTWDNNSNANYSFQIEKVELGLVPKENCCSMVTKKGLRKTYILKKKIKLAVYKFFRFFPRIIANNNKGKVTEQ